jgi:hypothetical protein
LARHPSDHAADARPATEVLAMNRLFLASRAERRQHGEEDVAAATLLGFRYSTRSTIDRSLSVLGTHVAQCQKRL